MIDLRKAKFLLAFLALVFCESNLCKAQDSSSTKRSLLFAGLRFQKAVGFYWANGISAELSSAALLKQKISLGVNIVSSRLGSALASNAIPYTEINISAIKYFRGEKHFKPLVRLNVGYAHADFGSDEFADIPNRSALASLEAGAAYDLKLPLRISLTAGYNIITGNGMKGLGLIYPLYTQCSVFYRISL